jgi:hypothetical protein
MSNIDALRSAAHVILLEMPDSIADRGFASDDPVAESLDRACPAEFFDSGQILIRETENTLYWWQRVRRRDRSVGSLENRLAAFFSRLAHLADQHSGPFRIDLESIIGS